MPKWNTTVALAVASLFACATIGDSARAEFIAEVEQVGSNVVLAGSGSINLTALTFFESSEGANGLLPVTGQLSVGPSFSFDDIYSGVVGPTSFGSGIGQILNPGTGDYVGVAGTAGLVAVPAGYISGSALSGSATIDDTTLASLGVTLGTYTYTWGSGPDADSFVVNVIAATPLPAALPLFAGGLGAMGLFGWRRKRKAPMAVAV